MQLNIHDTLYHPCSIDILEFKVTGIRQYEDHKVYEAKAAYAVGACGRMEVLLTMDKYNVIRFMGVEDSYNHEYAYGLEDFVEGTYYLERLEARLAYNEQQRILAWSSMENKKRIYEESKTMYDKVEKIVAGIKADIKETKETND